MSEDPPRRHLREIPMVYPPPEPEQVTVVAGIEYAQAATGPLTLDLYAPVRTSPRRAPGDCARRRLPGSRLREAARVPVQGHGHVHVVGPPGRLVRHGGLDIRQRAAGRGPRCRPPLRPGARRRIGDRRRTTSALGPVGQRAARPGRAGAGAARVVPVRDVQLRLSRRSGRRHAHRGCRETVGVHQSRRVRRGGPAGRPADPDRARRAGTGPGVEPRGGPLRRGDAGRQPADHVA